MAPKAPSMPPPPPMPPMPVIPPPPPTQAELDAEAAKNVQETNKRRKISSQGTILAGDMYGSGLPPVARKTLLSGAL